MVIPKRAASVVAEFAITHAGILDLRITNVLSCSAGGHMLKPVDLLVGLKILTSKKQNWTQMGIATELCISSSQVNAAIKQLIEGNLFTLRQGKPRPVYAALKEFILFGAPYCFPAKPMALTVGIATAYAAEPLSHEISLGSDPIPVWPYAQGKNRGVALEPLHKNVPKALSHFPDSELHEILVLFDAVRIGRAREKKMAQRLLTKKLDDLADITEAME